MMKLMFAVLALGMCTVLGAAEADSPLARCEAALQKMELKTSPAQWASLIDNIEYRNALTEATFIDLVTPKAFDKVKGYKKGESFIRDILTHETMADFINSGPVDKKKGARCLDILYLLYSNDLQKNWRDPLYRKVAIAIALGAGGNNYSVNEAYKLFVKSHKDGYLHTSFDNLTVRDMRFVVNIDPDDMRYVLERNTYGWNGYGSAAWQCSWIRNNCFGNSIHGPLYYKPWDHIYGRSERSHKVGGVCGSLSTYGTMSARAHGIPATTAGQPGHCAYVVRQNNGRWTIHYNVGRWTSPHQTFWGVGGYPSLNMMEDVFADPKAYTRAENLCRVAARMTASDKKSFDPQIDALYRKATATVPAAYPVWRQWGDYLKRCDNITSQQWRDWSVAVANGLKDHQQAAWKLVMAYAVPGVSKEGDKGRLALYTAVHEVLKESAAKVSEPVNFASIIGEQDKSLGKNDDVKLQLFSVMLKAHDGSRNNFPSVMKWGSDKFLKNKALSPKFIAAIDDFYASRKDTSGNLKSFLRNSIRTASEAGDVDLFQQLAGMVAALESKKPDTSFIKSSHRLISDAGLLKISSSSRNDRPLFYPKMIDASAPSEAFQTNKEKNPWAMVMLKGDAEVADIYIKNTGGKDAARNVPLVVSVSTDGKAWKEVFRTEKVEKEWMIDLSGSPERARYIKAERLADAKDEPFHLHKIQVYGKNLF